MNIEVKNLSFQFGQHVLFEKLFFKVSSGTSMAICGNSGCGKSTLLALLAGFVLPYTGEIFFNDILLTSLKDEKRAEFRARHLGFVFQFHHLLQDFTVLENVMIPCLLLKQSRVFAQKQAMLLLERVGVGELAKRYPQELSGGEHQRVALARALVHRPALILADEPTGNLDAHNADLVFLLLQELVKELKSTLVVVTHQEDLANKMDITLNIPR